MCTQTHAFLVQIQSEVVVTSNFRSQIVSLLTWIRKLGYHIYIRTVPSRKRLTTATKAIAYWPCITLLKQHSKQFWLYIIHTEYVFAKE